MINYIPQINVDKILKYSGRRVVAGEDGFIKIIIREENIEEYKIKINKKNKDKNILNNKNENKIEEDNTSASEKVLKSFRETEIILEPMTGNDDFLASIEDVDEFENGDLISCTSDGDFGLYELKNKKINPSAGYAGAVNAKNPNTISYTFKKLNIKIKEDCIYNIRTKESPSARSFTCSGERGVGYTFEI